MVQANGILIGMDDLLRDAASRAIRYLNEVQERPAAPTRAAVAALSALREPMPHGPSSPESVLDLLDSIGSPATTAMAGPRFFGFVIGGALPAPVAANWLATAWDQNPGLHLASPVATELEEITLGWLLDVLGLPVRSAGSFVTGATVANFTALAAARHAVLRDAGWDVEADGLFGAPEITVVIGAEGHPSMVKALGMLGFGRERVVRVPVDGQGRMIPSAFPKIDSPAIVCLQAGNVNSGAFDPASELIPLCRTAGAWIHVDGAFGLWAAASPRLRALVQGFSEADSWATDAHKWLNVPYDSGLAFVRDGEALRAAMSISAAYLPQGEHREPSNFVPELSRRARGVDIWAALKSLGRSGLAAMIEGNCAAARQFADGLREAGFEVLNEVVLNQVVVSFGSAEFNRRVVEGVLEDGTCWCGGTLWQGRSAMRISVSSWRTTPRDVERSLEAIIRVARSVVTGA
jgi:glutamate/tyrosine decarboxylase-like PLP-dependent enzyme